MKRNYGSFIVRVPRWRRIPTANGFTTVEEPPTEHQVLVDIDLDRLVRQLGPKAVRSKAGKSNLLGGIITVTEKKR